MKFFKLGIKDITPVKDTEKRLKFLWRRPLNEDILADIPPQKTNNSNMTLKGGEEQWIQNHPQYLSGLSRALLPTTFLEIAVYDYIFHGLTCMLMSKNASNDATMNPEGKNSHIKKLPMRRQWILTIFTLLGSVKYVIPDLYVSLCLHYGFPAYISLQRSPMFVWVTRGVSWDVIYL